MSEIDIRAILIANIMGITVLLSVVRGHWWRLKDTSRENRIMVMMFFVCLISCILDPLCFWADGKQGVFNTVLIWVSNTWLYLANIAISLCFHALVTSHLGIQLHRIRQILLAIPCIVLCGLLIVNLFIPIVFSVGDNIYRRTELYYLYLAVEAAIALDGLALYLYILRTSGRLRFFPAASFLGPAVVGIIVQTVVYGVSTMFPLYAVSFGCVATSLQNENVYRDRLTGLYNRSFFNMLEKKLKKNTDREYVAMMLDVNDFKYINDTFGHNIGDRALIEVSTIFHNVIRENGIVIRYAGDEFIIILNNATDRTTDKTLEAIYAELARFNSTSGNPYELSVSIGYCKVNLKEHSMNELVDKIDKLMYENKRIYYGNKRVDRRK